MVACCSHRSFRGPCHILAVRPEKEKIIQTVPLPAVQSVACGFDEVVFRRVITRAKPTNQVSKKCCLAFVHERRPRNRRVPNLDTAQGTPTRAHEGTEQGRHPFGCGQAMLPSDTRAFRLRLVVSLKAELDSQESLQVTRLRSGRAIWFGLLSVVIVMSQYAPALLQPI